MRYNDPNFRRTVIGMPDSHAEAFKAVAVGQRCVIITRATGPTCLQLLEQGYDTKGFRIHGKSCDWGPMAGFVLRDPRLNKAGQAKVEYNAKEHDESLSDTKNRAGWVADTTPLKLYPQRVDWLREQGLIDARLNAAQNRFDGQCSKHGVTLRYSLRKEFSRDGVVWGVYIEDAGFLDKKGKAGNAGDPMLAMTNPAAHRSWPLDDFRNAVTGDYDLFAVWPYEENYDHDGDDRRVLGTAQNWSQREHIEKDLERNFTAPGPLGQAQGTKLGNMTNRLYMVCQLLNSQIGGSHSAGAGRTWGPFPKRSVCWHSDEALRPAVNDVDLPVLAFAPSRHELGIETIHDFRFLILKCIAEHIRPILGEGWTLQPTAEKPNRLGGFADLVPSWMGGQWKQPGWYNR